jgi:WD40 repeat protein
VQLWDVATGKPLGPALAGHTADVYGVAFSPDGTLLATSSIDHTVRLWDTATTYSISKPPIEQSDTVWGVAFSPDGRLLATTGYDRTARLWDRGTGDPVGAPLTGHAGARVRSRVQP